METDLVDRLFKAAEIVEFLIASDGKSPPHTNEEECHCDKCKLEEVRQTITEALQDKLLDEDFELDGEEEDEEEE